MAAPPLIVSVDAYQLSNPDYVVTRVDRENTAIDQLNQAAAYASRGIDPRDAIRDYPTRLTVFMRPLAADGVIERAYSIAASATVSPRGIDFTTPGGEP